MLERRRLSSLACRRHGHRLDLCPQGAAEGLWPPSSGGQRDGGPDSSPGGFFIVPPPPQRGTRAAAKQRYQSPPREEEEPELQLRPPLDPPLFSPTSPPGLLVLGGSRGGDSGRAGVCARLSGR